MPMIRYPGSKAKLINQIAKWFPSWTTLRLFADPEMEYREPFVGSGAMAFFVLSNLADGCRVWLNDIDGDLTALWQAVHKSPRELMKLVVDFTPSVDKFYSFKLQDNATRDEGVVRGFRKLALHRMSVSGFGYMAGGPIGGKEQGTAYNVECRWNPTAIKRQVKTLHNCMARFGDRLKITSLPFSSVLAGAGEDCFAYIDPPYYEKGPMLYRYALTHELHVSLANELRCSKCQWVASYDDHPIIRDLYKWADIYELQVRYSNAVIKNKERPKNKEIAIVRVAA